MKLGSRTIFVLEPIRKEDLVMEEPAPKAAPRKGARKTSPPVTEPARSSARKDYTIAEGEPIEHLG
jgi:hypothetical protein